ncbi:shikimate dehydrogenase [Candidatus Pelagibacter sp.]|nr:shikimate dehydrogenase [Candidatus Pelagibacter sp.]
MKKYLVIGSPINHSLSPRLHNFWIKKNNLNAVYEKKELNVDEIGKIINKVKTNNINGINVTVPFKKEVIKYLDKLSTEATDTQSVNTIYLEGKKIVGHNTDIYGFHMSIKKSKFDLRNKKIFILGAGGVVPSIIYSLNKMKVAKIFVSNRTKNKAENLNKLFKNLEIVEWGFVPDFDVIINATSLGLNQNDNFNLNLNEIGANKIFYDVIYNPKETKFLNIGKKSGNKTLNGKMMFIYQAFASFKLWHNIDPKINDEVIGLLYQ